MLNRGACEPGAPECREMTEEGVRAAGSRDADAGRDLAALHARFPLAGTRTNGLLSADTQLPAYLRSVLRGEPLPPPDRDSAEWMEVMSLLDPHGLRPYLAWMLMRTPERCRPPGPVRTVLKRDLLFALESAGRDDRLTGMLVGSLEDRGVAPVLIKGAALGRSVYPDAALRPSVDVDILVREAALPVVRDVMRSRGYRLGTDKHSLAATAYTHLEFEHVNGRRGGKKVEVNWRVADGFTAGPGRLDGLFDRAVTVPYAAFPFRTLDPVDHLVYSSYHALYQHGRSLRLGWIADIALLVASLDREEDGERVVQRAAEYDAVEATRAGLRLATLWFGSARAAAWVESAWPDPSPAERRAWRLRPAASLSPVAYAVRKFRLLGSNRARGAYLRACAGRMRPRGFWREP